MALELTNSAHQQPTSKTTIIVLIHKIKHIREPEDRKTLQNTTESDITASE
jgi:hypothetical protein